MYVIIVLRNIYGRCLMENAPKRTQKKSGWLTSRNRWYTVYDRKGGGYMFDEFPPLITTTQKKTGGCEGSVHDRGAIWGTDNYHWDSLGG